jgi:hypothetical protein
MGTVVADFICYSKQNTSTTCMAHVAKKSGVFLCQQNLKEFYVRRISVCSIFSVKYF